jgi:hypothetical protein
VIGRKREADIAKPKIQIREEARGFGNGLPGIEGIRQSPLQGGRGHELRDALCARRAGNIWLEVAFDPNKARQQAGRQVSDTCGALNDPARCFVSYLGWSEARDLRISWRYQQRHDKGYRS